MLAAVEGKGMARESPERSGGVSAGAFQTDSYSLCAEDTGLLLVLKSSVGVEKGHSQMVP